MNRLMMAVLVTLALGAAACSSSQPSPAPSSAASTALPLPTSDPKDVHAFADLESKLPAQIAGRSMTRASYALDSEGEADSLSVALQGAGRDATTLQMAVEYPSDNAGDITILAYREPGMAGSDLLALLTPDVVEGTIASSTVGGRQVSTITDDGGTAYAYASGDVLYLVAGDPSVTEAAIAALP